MKCVDASCLLFKLNKRNTRMGCSDYTWPLILPFHLSSIRSRCSLFFNMDNTYATKSTQNVKLWILEYRCKGHIFKKTRNPDSRNDQEFEFVTYVLCFLSTRVKLACLRTFLYKAVNLLWWLIASEADFHVFI